MVADQGLADTQLLGEVGDAQLLAGQQLHDPPAQRIAQGAGDLQRRGGSLGVGRHGRGHLDQE
jgi:hypothetical protein